MEPRRRENEILTDTLNLQPVHLGLTTSYMWRNDPKHLLFFLARYKFAAKMLDGYTDILEVGCGDGFGARLLEQNGSKVYRTDADRDFIIRASRDNPDQTFYVHDFAKSRMAVELFDAEMSFDAAFAIDVIEHIRLEDEFKFFEHIRQSISKTGVCLFGTPSLESQVYASEASKIGHVNCKSGEVWKSSLQLHFRHVFAFSMNDEVVHTGFSKMAHYLFFLCVP